MFSAKVTPASSALSTFRMCDQIQLKSEPPVSQNQNKELPKKQIHTLIFLLNVIGMIMGCYQIVFHVFRFWTPSIRGMMAASILVYNIVIVCPTMGYLTDLKTILKQAILLDTLLIATAVAIVAFVNMMIMFDQGQNNLYHKIIEISLTFQLILYKVMTRVLLLTLDWKKWQLLVFKLHLMANALMLFVAGVHFIWVDFTYTMRMLPAFDAKAHDYLLMFIFAMFSCINEYYNKVTDLDYTGMLKYVYRIKNVD